MWVVERDNKERLVLFIFILAGNIKILKRILKGEFFCLFVFNVMIGKFVCYWGEII